MSDTKQLLDTMVSRFNASAAGDLEAVFQYHIEEGGDYYLEVADGQCALSEGEHDDASVTLSLDQETLSEILSGETDGMQAFMAGRVKAGGNVMLATRLAELFPLA
ncbi:SCP2 sterol-binding domain-containing protein [Motiliproteus sediminis]|uniref:SCP2 sterol-binding domain-containing protein n=1 Tax=Motiliproteus sediminis TaxID=1468178 RepID=UPI001AEFFA84|nr:SCP2 sterol-binding domain-containing protein [Motiliproteus sediminis]